MKIVFSLIFMFTQISSASAGELSCDKAEDVNAMSTEIMSQLGCSGVKKIYGCNALLGIALASTPLVAIAAIGINRTRAGMGGKICNLPTRGGALWRSLLPEVSAKDCVGTAEQIVSDVGNYSNAARNEMYAAVAEQDRAIMQQLRIVRDTAVDNRYKGSPANFEHSRIIDQASKEYAASVNAIDSRYIPQMADHFETLANAHPDVAVREQASRLVADLRKPAEAAGDFRQYKSMDQLMDLFELRRPAGRSLLSNTEKNLARAKAENLYQERIMDISDQKRVLTNRVNAPELSRPALGGPNSLAYTSVEEYEIAKMDAELKQYKSSAYPEFKSAEPVKPGDLPKMEGGRFTPKNGYAHFERRFPMLAEDQRLTYEMVHLGEQQQRLNYIAQSFNSANSTNLQVRNAAMRAAQSEATVSLKAATELAKGLPEMPAGSTAETNRKIIQARIENLERRQVYELTPSIIQKFGLQEAMLGFKSVAEEAAGAARFVSTVGKFAGRIVLGPLATALGISDAMAFVPGSDKVRCQTPCSAYLTQDTHCEPTFSNQTVEFLKLDAKAQMNEFNKCPEMCKAFKGFYDQALPTNKWAVACPDGGSPQNITLKSKEGKKRVKFDVADGTEQIRIDDDESPANARVAFLNDGVVTSVRVPDTRTSASMSGQGIRKVLAMTNPHYYHEVSAKRMTERPEKWWEQEAINMDSLVKELNYTRTQGQACCEMAAGQRPTDSAPGARRCLDYGVKIDTGAPAKGGAKGQSKGAG